MIKNIFAAALVAMMLISIPVSAQNNNGKVTLFNSTEKSINESRQAEAKTGQKDCKEGKQTCNKEGKAVCKDSVKSCKGDGLCEFEGLNLTDSQKSQLKTLKENRKAKAREARQDKKEAQKAERQEMKTQREAERRAYLEEVKQILGPDNYVIFLENQYVQVGNRPDMRKGGGAKASKAGAGRPADGKKKVARSKSANSTVTSAEVQEQAQPKTVKPVKK